MRGELRWAGAAAIALLSATATPARAQADARDYRIETQELGAALRAFAAASDREVVADASLLGGKRSRRVAGRFDAETALRLLLEGTDLSADLVEGAFVIRAGLSRAPAETVQDLGIRDVARAGFWSSGSPTR